MKSLVALLLMTCGTGAVCLAASRNDDRWPVRAEDMVEKTMPLSGAPARVVLDNFEGFVHVTGTSRSDVRIRAHKTVRADSDADLSLANSEVKLEMTSKPGTASVYYAAPWRCEGVRDGHECEHQERRFYSVAYDLEVEIPRDARLYASTVNRGDVRVADTRGNFEIKGVNGPITLTGVSGSGDVHTVNGPVDVVFAANPKENCSFKTINGSLNVTFKPSLSADFLFKTFNGEIFSDFDVTARATPVSQAERNDGRFVYRSNRERGARTGNGGPELHFNTLNGNINLRTTKGGR